MKTGLVFVATLFVAVSAQNLHAAKKPSQLIKPVSLEAIRGEINAIERDLLMSRETQASAASQLRKIRRLISLQGREIEISRKRVTELGQSLDDLSAQKKTLLESIERQKASLKTRLRELERMTQGFTDAFDARWLGDLEADNQKTYFLQKTLHKNLTAMDRLKSDVVQAQALELRILEERNKLDYYAQELASQMTLLSANEEVQKEIIRTNRSNRLEALGRMRSLKESEQELEDMLVTIKESRQEERKPTVLSKELAADPKQKLVVAPTAPLPSLAGGLEATLAALKGRLPYPVSGTVVSGFGKSYNRKTNLFTFQKGITLEAPPSAQVAAVAAGKVVFAGPLKNYGLIAIVEHPGQYYTLYGQMGSVAVSIGNPVRQGDVLGKTAGEPIYFEIRNKNVAINPIQWLSSGGNIALSKQ